MKVIQLTQNQVAYVDEEDYNFLSAYKWCAKKDHNTFYAQRRVKGRNILMHHFIMGHPPEGMHIDHIDRNGINNQRSNLRFVTIGENNRNRSHIISKHKGVWFIKKTNMWAAVLYLGGKKVKYLTRYNTEEEAAEFIKQYYPTS